MHGDWIYQVPTLAKPSDADTWHPEIAARVWATSRAQVLSSPTALVTRGRAAGQKRCGALEAAPEQLIGIQPVAAGADLDSHRESHAFEPAAGPLDDVGDDLTAELAVPDLVGL